MTTCEHDRRLTEGCIFCGRADPRTIDAMEGACQRGACGHRWIDHGRAGSFFPCAVAECECVDFRTGSERERVMYPMGENDPGYALSPKARGIEIPPKARGIEIRLSSTIEHVANEPGCDCAACVAAAIRGFYGD